MKIEILNIAETLAAEQAERATAGLKSIRGVHDVSVLDAPVRLTASIDEQLTGRAELVAVLARLGVRVDEKKPSHAKGGCCGGCGGS